MLINGIELSDSFVKSLENIVHNSNKMSISHTQEGMENEKMQKKNAFKQKFAEINSTLKSIADVFNHTSVNNTIELQLTDNQTITEDSDPNLMILQLSIFDKTNTMQTILTAPYFLVVGYPNTDQIRLTTYDTGDEGRKMPIDQINSQLIEESVLEFLQKNV